MAGAVITGMTIVSHVISQTRQDAPGLLGTYFADGPLGGRGLVLVDNLADTWGTTRKPSGKTVWFRLGAARS